MLQTLQIKYEEKINAEFDQFSFGLNTEARLMLEEIRDDIKEIHTALQVANEKIFADLYGPNKKQLDHLKTDLMADCETVESLCMSTLSKISMNMLNAIAHPRFEPMSLHETKAKFAINTAIKQREKANSSASLKELFDAGSSSVQDLLDLQYASIKFQMERSKGMLETYCQRFSKYGKHKQIKTGCDGTYIGNETIKAQNLLKNSNVTAINALTRLNLVDKIFEILSKSFKRLSKLGDDQYLDGHRVIYYLIY